jgi:hypothetical protein
MSTDPTGDDPDRRTLDQFAPKTLMIAFAVIVRDKLGDGTPKVTLPDWNDPIEALVYGGDFT